MSFAVDLPVLGEVPGMCDRLAQDAKTCRSYAGEYFHFAYGPGLLNEISGQHAKACDSVDHQGDFKVGDDFLITV
ncbi:MAG: hypothetical protein KJO75_08395 [Dactylosporangium sp.]|nr:hypothetical protein [Dactylosporangium sp.]